MRLIILDTETTGGSTSGKDACCDIGLVEMVGGHPTGNQFQVYINPKMAMNPFAQKVHGLTTEFLSDKPLFADVAGEVLDFIDGSPCLAHNARFDRSMLLHDFHRSGLELPMLQFFDTVPFARNELKLQRVNLNAVVSFLNLSTADRTLHGALLDAQILSAAVERINEIKPGALDRLLNGNPLSALPKGLPQPVRETAVRRDESSGPT